MKILVVVEGGILTDLRTDSNDVIIEIEVFDRDNYRSQETIDDMTEDEAESSFWAEYPYEQY